MQRINYLYLVKGLAEEKDLFVTSVVNKRKILFKFFYLDRYK